MHRYSFYNQKILNKNKHSFFSDCSTNCFNKGIVMVSFKQKIFRLNPKDSILPHFFETIFWQKPKLSFSKKNISNWSLKENDLVSVYCTLRNKQLFLFLEKFLLHNISNNMQIKKSNQSNLVQLECRSVFNLLEWEKELSFLSHNNLADNHLKLQIILFVNNSSLHKHKILNNV